MDQRGVEKEESKGDVDAAAEGENNHEEAEETAVLLIKAKEAEAVAEAELVGGAEETTALPPLLAHPCSLLQLLLRACVGCLGRHGYCSDDDKHTKPAADVPAVAAAAADSPQEGDGLQSGSDTAASYVCTQVVVVTDQMRAVRGRTPPGPPREGPGGDGGQHN